MNRSAPLKRRHPLRRVGARKRRELDALASFRRAVLERARGRCERCGERRALHAHHLLPRSRGGKHELSNGAALCGGPDGCHDAVHSHTAPDWRAWVL